MEERFKRRRVKRVNAQATGGVAPLLRKRVRSDRALTSKKFSNNKNNRNNIKKN